jgi:hypothetical protein
LLKFKLLEQQQLRLVDFVGWAVHTSYFQLIHEKFFPVIPIDDWIKELTEELVHSGVMRRDGAMIYNA